MSADVHFSARNEVRTKRKRSSRPHAVVCTENFQNFAYKNDSPCFHSLYCRKEEHLAFSEDNFFIKKEDMSSNRRTYDNPRIPLQVFVLIET